MQALQGEMTATRLHKLELDLDDEWKRLCSKIRYLDKRIEMIHGVKDVADACNDHMEGEKPLGQFLYRLRLSMLTLEIQLGTENIRRLLENQPLEFIIALIGLFESKEDWFQNDQVDETEFLSSFFIHLSVSHQTVYNKLPDGTQGLCFEGVEEDSPRYAREAGLPEIVVNEVAERTKSTVAHWADNMEIDLVLDAEALAVVDPQDDTPAE